MEPFKKLTGIAAPITGRNIDTDQILPGRFLKQDRTKQDYSNAFFHDLRFTNDGQIKSEFILNQDKFKAAKILVADTNFGCGSSREGAVYATVDYGIRAIIAPSFGDIFFNNCLKNGVVPVRLPEDIVTELRNDLVHIDKPEITIDLENCLVILPNQDSHTFAIETFWRNCLLKGVDDLTLTLEHQNEIEQFEEKYYELFPWAQVPSLEPNA